MGSFYGDDYYIFIFWAGETSSFIDYLARENPGYTQGSLMIPHRFKDYFEIKFLVETLHVSEIRW